MCLIFYNEVNKTGIGLVVGTRQNWYRLGVRNHLTLFVLAISVFSIVLLVLNHYRVLALFGNM